jgi:hypothetical protein
MKTLASSISDTASLTEDSRVIIYDRNLLIIQATDYGVVYHLQQHRVVHLRIIWVYSQNS